jgi:hypothetical protein
LGSFRAVLAVFEVQIEICYELQTVINLYHNHLFWHENTYIFAPYWLFWLEMPFFGPESPHCSQKGPTYQDQPFLTYFAVNSHFSAMKSPWWSQDGFLPPNFCFV